ncbi:metal-sensitive transcriptional regulator [Proteiniclasticum sp. C24MP]|uniref:metal-sensitive transcriptional regulator n=1 Tax=Proteiniclasticum sp. C24MP TaxID=3374101 RepID=UPI00375517FE
MADKKKLMNRLSRTEGQIRGITKMIEEDRDCREIVIQLAAVRAGVDKVINLIVTENLMSCVLSDTDEIDKKQLEEALELIFKLK